jgi:hypothetical protein
MNGEFSTDYASVMQLLSQLGVVLAGDTTMKTTVATAILTVIFLSVGAFAGSAIRIPVAATTGHVNVTVIVKNQSWPVMGQITLESCAVNRCIDI